MTADTRILVLREGTHGMPVEAYAAQLRDRLPGVDVRLAETPDDERELAAEADVISAVSLPDEVLAAADDLQLFAGMYAGADHLPLSDLADRGVAVTTASGVHGPNVAEHVLGAMLGFARKFHVGRRRQDRREWRHYQAGEFQDSTVAVVGMGPIGRAICERLSGFGVDTVGVRYTPEKGGPADEILGLDRTHDALAVADYVALACPLTDATRGLIDDRAFRTLSPDAVLVNVARGPVVDTDALVAALRENRIGGAALDVTDPEPLPEDHPLWTFDNVQITPHNAGHTPRYYERVADIVAENVGRLEDGEETLRNQETLGGD